LYTHLNSYKIWTLQVVPTVDRTKTPQLFRKASDLKRNKKTPAGKEGRNLPGYNRKK
jgi:hypothetical protein